MISKYIIILMFIAIIVLIFFCVNLYQKFSTINNAQVEQSKRISVNSENNIATTETELISLKGKNNALISEINQLNNKNLSIQKDLNEQINKLNEEKNLLQKSVNAAQNEVNNLSSRLNNVEKLEIENVNLKNKIDALLQEIKEYKIKISSIKNGVSLYSDKTIKSTFLFANGVKIGEERIYFKGYSLLNKIKNWENGILNGLSTTFYKTGERYIEANYKNGKLDGSYVVYEKDGSIIANYKYANGDIINE